MTEGSTSVIRAILIVSIIEENIMKFNTLFIFSCLIFFVSTTATGANPNANWKALVADGYSLSDTVLSGKVQDVEDQTAVDGGHIYTVEVTGTHKGAPAKRVSVRAGGFFYVVQFDNNEDVMLFLKKTPEGMPESPRTDYTLVAVDNIRPVAFRVSDGNARPLDGRLKAEFATVNMADLKQYLDSMKP